MDRSPVSDNPTTGTMSPIAARHAETTPDRNKTKTLTNLRKDSQSLGSVSNLNFLLQEPLQFTKFLTFIKDLINNPKDSELVKQLANYRSTTLIPLLATMLSERIFDDEKLLFIPSENTKLALDFIIKFAHQGFSPDRYNLGNDQSKILFTNMDELHKLLSPATTITSSKLLDWYQSPTTLFGKPIGTTHTLSKSKMLNSLLLFHPYHIKQLCFLSTNYTRFPKVNLPENSISLQMVRVWERILLFITKIRKFGDDFKFKFLVDHLIFLVKKKLAISYILVHSGYTLDSLCSIFLETNISNFIKMIQKKSLNTYAKNTPPFLKDFPLYFDSVKNQIRDIIILVFGFKNSGKTLFTRSITGLGIPKFPILTTTYSPTLHFHSTLGYKTQKQRQSNEITIIFPHENLLLCKLNFLVRCLGSKSKDDLRKMWTGYIDWNSPHAEKTYLDTFLKNFINSFTEIFTKEYDGSIVQTNENSSSPILKLFTSDTPYFLTSEPINTIFHSHKIVTENNIRCIKFHNITNQQTAREILEKYQLIDGIFHTQSFKVNNQQMQRKSSDQKSLILSAYDQLLEKISNSSWPIFPRVYSSFPFFKKNPHPLVSNNTLQIIDPPSFTDQTNARKNSSGKKTHFKSTKSLFAYLSPTNMPSRNIYALFLCRSDGGLTIEPANEHSMYHQFIKENNIPLIRVINSFNSSNTSNKINGEHHWNDLGKYPKCIGSLKIEESAAIFLDPKKSFKYSGYDPVTHNFTRQKIDIRASQDTFVLSRFDPTFTTFLAELQIPVKPHYYLILPSSFTIFEGLMNLADFTKSRIKNYLKSDIPFPDKIITGDSIDEIWDDIDLENFSFEYKHSAAKKFAEKIYQNRAKLFLDAQKKLSISTTLLKSFLYMHENQLPKILAQKYKQDISPTITDAICHLNTEITRRQESNAQNIQDDPTPTITPEKLEEIINGIVTKLEKQTDTQVQALVNTMNDHFTSGLQQFWKILVLIFYNSAPKLFKTHLGLKPDNSLDFKDDIPQKIRDALIQQDETIYSQIFNLPQKHPASKTLEESGKANSQIQFQSSTSTTSSASSDPTSINPSKEPIQQDAPQKKKNPITDLFGDPPLKTLKESGKTEDQINSQLYTSTTSSDSTLPYPFETSRIINISWLIASYGSHRVSKPTENEKQDIETFKKDPTKFDNAEDEISKIKFRLPGWFFRSTVSIPEILGYIKNRETPRKTRKTSIKVLSTAIDNYLKEFLSTEHNNSIKESIRSFVPTWTNVLQFDFPSFYQDLQDAISASIKDALQKTIQMVVNGSGFLNAINIYLLGVDANPTSPLITFLQFYKAILVHNHCIYKKTQQEMFKDQLLTSIETFKDHMHSVLTKRISKVSETTWDTYQSNQLVRSHTLLSEMPPCPSEPLNSLNDVYLSLIDRFPCFQNQLSIIPSNPISSLTSPQTFSSHSVSTSAPKFQSGITSSLQKSTKSNHSFKT